MGRPKGSINDKVKKELKVYLSRGEFSGKCYCGCGGYTELASTTRRNRDGSLCSVRGYSLRYLEGHEPQIQPGSRNANFKGIQRRSGYVMLYKPDHQRAVRDYVPEHVLVMENGIGRHLSYYGFNHRDNEIVHHKDEVRDNNDPGNLVLLTHGEHSRRHRKAEMGKKGFSGFGCHAKGYGKLNRDTALSMLKEIHSEELTKTEAAKKYGVTRTTVHNYVTGKQALPKH